MSPPPSQYPRNSNNEGGATTAASAAGLSTTSAGVEVDRVKRVLRNEKRTLKLPTIRVRSSESRGETVSSGSKNGKEGGSVRYTMKTGPKDDVYL